MGEHLCHALVSLAPLGCRLGSCLSCTGASRLRNCQATNHPNHPNHPHKSANSRQPSHRRYNLFPKLSFQNVIGPCCCVIHSGSSAISQLAADLWSEFRIGRWLLPLDVRLRASVGLWHPIRALRCARRRRRLQVLQEEAAICWVATTSGQGLLHLPQHHSPREGSHE